MILLIGFPFLTVFGVYILRAFFVSMYRPLWRDASDRTLGLLAVSSTFLLSVFAISGMAYYRWKMPDPNDSLTKMYLMFSGIILGFLIQLVPYSFVVHILSLLLQRFSKRFLKSKATVFSARDWNPARRNFLTQGLSLGGATFGTGVGAYQCLSGPKVCEVSIPISNLPEDLVGLKIVQISDLHIGPSLTKSDVQKITEYCNSLKPDILALTGDFVDGTPDILHNTVQELSQLRAKHGIYYVTGNHEYYWGAQTWIHEFRKFNWNVLINENRILNIGKSQIMIAGVTDEHAETFMLEHTCDPERARQLPVDIKTENLNFKLLLAHRPNTCLLYPSDYFDLQLSGHTHGGQMFPFTLAMPFFQKYYKGLNRHENKLWVYVNSGTGYWGPANRFLVNAEISLLTLKAHRGEN